ncbi:MAG: AAA family ATPase [Rickettsiales bacterium]|nr:AAA family ATPase [Rickettsiales bacterium]
MKYKSFKITNYKWIEDLEISFTEGNLLILSGLNKSEKTTVLDAINNWGLMTKKQYLENGKKNALLPKYKTLWTGTISIGAVLNIKGCKAELDCFEPKSDELEIIFGYSVENGQFTTNEPSCTFRIKGKAVDNNDNSLQQSSILEKTPDILYYDDFCYDVPKEIKFELATTDSTNELINKMWQSILSDAFLSFKKAKQEHKTEVTFESFIKNFSEEDKKDNASNTLSQLSTYISNQIREPWNKKSSFKEIRLEYSKIDNAIYFWFKVISENGSDFAVNERSKWFKWFFSFIMLTTFRMSRNSNTLFLLDEPASSLHTSVQEEVTQLIIELTNECQVIYTTNKGIKLNVKDLFNYSTISKLANKIVNKDNLYISTKTNLLLLQDIENNLARTDTKVTYDLKKT